MAQPYPGMGSQPEEKNYDEKRVQPPPPPPVSVRTMNSDVKSIEQSGGGKPTGEIINMPKSSDVFQAQKPKEEEVKIKIPGYVGPEKSAFSPETLSSVPPTNRPTPPAFPTAPRTAPLKGGGKKSVWIIAGIVVAAIAVGAVLYFFVYPAIFPTETTTPPPATPPTTSPATENQKPAAIVHRSYIASDKIEVVPSLNLASSESATVDTPILKEVVLSDENGNQVPFSTYWPALFPEFSGAEIQEIFAEDFTAFIYYDAEGSWPGYVVKIKNGVSLALAQTTFGKIETAPSLTSLFLQNPGDASKLGFQSGTYQNIGTRYLPYEAAGAAIDYAWINNYLVIGTHFPGFKAAIARLQAPE